MGKWISNHGQYIFETTGPMASEQYFFCNSRRSATYSWTFFKIYLFKKKPIIYLYLYMRIVAILFN